MGEKSRFYSYFGKEFLNGGLNTSDNPLIVGPAEMTEANNVNIAQSLARRKRPGQENYTISTYEGTASWPEVDVPIRGAIQYWRFLSSSGGSEEDIFLHSSDEVWSVASRISEGINRSNGFTFSSTSVPSYQVFEGILYFVSTDPATDGYKKWNGRADTPGDVEDAVGPADGDPKYLSTWRARMMAAGVIDFPFRLYISGPLDAEEWDSSDGATSLDIDYDGDPDGITALFGEYQGNFYFATSRSVYELSALDASDVSTYQVSRITDGIGCVGPNMFCQTPNDILFWSYRGLHSLKKTITSDQVEFNFLSRPLQKTIVEQINADLFFQGSCQWDKVQNLVVTTLPSAGQQTNDIILTYNITFGLWTNWMGCDARCLFNLLIDRKEYVGEGREDGKLAFLNPDITTDFDEGFFANFKTGKLFPGGDIVFEKSFKSCTILISSTRVSDITVEWAIDGRDGTKSSSKVLSLGNAAATLGSTFILGQSQLGIGRFIPLRFTIEDYGYNIQLNVLCSGDSDIEFYGFILEVDDGNEVFV